MPVYITNRAGIRFGRSLPINTIATENSYRSMGLPSICLLIYNSRYHKAPYTCELFVNPSTYLLESDISSFEVNRREKREFLMQKF
jgi:hypothetical protein